MKVKLRVILIAVFILGIWLLNVALNLRANNIYIVSQVNNFASIGKEPIEDFVEFPCLHGLMPSEDLEKSGKCVRSIAAITKGQHADLNKHCTYLHIGKATPICTYDPKTDMISRLIHWEGSWETQLITNMLQAMNKTPGMLLFDVGANIGVYCISAALFNKKVVCLDANYENVRKIARSLYLGQLTANATLMWNAVSDKHETVTFHLVKGNYGSSRIADVRKWRMEAEANINVDAIKLNDLKDYEGFKNSPVFMKLDVESHDLYVLNGAAEFFQKVDVRIVQMELMETSTKYEVIELFEKYGFLPYADPHGMRQLYKLDAFTTWPYDMYFIRSVLPNNPLSESERPTV